MAELKSYTCPNCGANTANARNCEYCGSLLVRLVDNGIDVDAYLSGHGALLGLSKALKDNLQLSKQNPNDPVATDVYGKYLATEDYNFVSVIPSDRLIFQNGRTVFPESKSGLGVIFSFTINNLKEDGLGGYDKIFVEEDKRIKKAHENFRKLEIFELFSSNVSKVNNGFIGKSDCYEYAIDFGKDADGAARLISDVLNNIFDVSYDATLKYTTNIGQDAIEKSRENYDEDSKYGSKVLNFTIVGVFALYFILRTLKGYFELTFLNIILLIIISFSGSVLIVSFMCEKDKKNTLKG